MPLSEAARLKLLAPPPAGKVRIVLDTDTYNEIDDQFAIVQMLLSRDRFDVEAIYAAPFFNKRSDGPGHGMELSYQEILRLLERLNVSPDGLVHRGVTAYVGAAKQAREATAVDDLIARARAGSPDNPLYIVAIAAISNVASALLMAPDIIDRVVVVWLGGHALEWPDTAEFNLRQDVGGAQVLLDSGVPLVLVPCLGVTSRLHSTVPEIERYVEPHGSIGAFLAQRFKEYSSDHLGWAKEIWDMAPVGWLLNPSWAPSVIVPAPVLTDQMTWSVDRRRHPIRYVTFIDRNAILKDFFLKMKAFAEKQA
ncbi:nucleoside hydrolase [Bradyrhizobium sp. ISRA443]|uniref:nucleoside hydrolase n=1 Tax=unclassified Bradyrhizobium TaxID=2631580 RepID=UPI002479B31A|nr:MULTISPECIES: nucleoside hydrolase [unclassified Bradyrhizobium]WGR92053.1 nucleoside hydrolase [Bradyrhizobium sp. ISRA435]WGS02494.1 nucleoside hydrolase [Bradyrhizobium sp. ISRA436]WGS09379.1 nucleoside hydrolase [Bradyrhizobium sp. ISRA437]WGS16268.1 nucleoside hydrolase [Bradyrhizobium sp. ISRA443]